MRLRTLKPHHSTPFAPVSLGDNEIGRAHAVPGFRQARSYTCGFATSLMVARHFRSDIAASELYRRLGTGLDGTRQGAIVRELRALGIRASLRYDAPFERLVTELERDKLLIGYLFDDEHWLVIYGYALHPRRVLVADPRPGEPCVHHWDDYGHRLGGFAIVCSAPDTASVNRTVTVSMPGSAGQIPFDF